MEASLLPAGWSAHQDPSSGNYYYVSLATGETTWTRPDPPPPVKMAPPAPPMVVQPSMVVAVEPSSPREPEAAGSGPVAVQPVLMPTSPATSAPLPVPQQAPGQVSAAVATASSPPSSGYSGYVPGGGGDGAAADTDLPVGRASVDIGRAKWKQMQSPALGSAYEQMRESQATPDPNWRPPTKALRDKPYGNCLCRISTRSIMTADWKPCLWVSKIPSSF